MWGDAARLDVSRKYRSDSGIAGVLHRWTWELTKDRIASLLAPLLLLFGGGFGWVLFFRDAAHRNDSLLRFLASATRLYAGE